VTRYAGFFASKRAVVRPATPALISASLASAATSAAPRRHPGCAGSLPNNYNPGFCHWWRNRLSQYEALPGALTDVESS